MYKAKAIEEILLSNKYSFSSDYRIIEDWISTLDRNFSKSLTKSHGYNRVVSLYDFYQLSKLENFQKINKVCVVSGSENELELNFVNSKEVLITSLESGYDLTDNWSSDNFKNFDAKGSFDFVICNQVLEHVPDPIKAFKNLNFLTKKGGYIWISIPVINRIHDEPNFYSSGYHPRYLKFLADEFKLDTIHIGAWGSLKYKLFAVSRNWPPLRKLKRGFRSNSDFIFPTGMFLDGRKLDPKHIVDTWGLFKKKY
jgi:SAM-dependent methyltransferase